MYFRHFNIISTWKKGMALYLNKFELSPWVLEKKMFKFYYVFLHFCYYHPLEENLPFIWTNSNPLYAGMLCAKFG